MPLPPPTPDSTPPWGFVEWVTTFLSGAILTVGGYVVRTRSKLSQHGDALDEHQRDIAELQNDMRKSKEILARHPTREDIRNDILRIEEIIENRFNQFDVRFDRLDGRVDSILNKR